MKKTLKCVNDCVHSLPQFANDSDLYLVKLVENFGTSVLLFIVPNIQYVSMSVTGLIIVYSDALGFYWFGCACVYV